MNYDDMPVGTYKKKSVPNDQLDESDNTGLSEEEATIEARILSKSWKKRLDAFSELKKDFEEAEPLSIELISKHTPSFGKYLGDSHPSVQKKVLEALMIVIERNPPVLASFLFDIVSSIMKLSSKSVRIEVGVALGGKANLRVPLMSSLLDQISGKNPPKIAVAALEVITALLNKFGNVVFPIKDIIPIVEKHGALSTNSAIRSEAMNYYKECFNWIGEEIMKYAKNLKSVQQEELAKAVGLSAKPSSDTKPEIKPIEEVLPKPLEEEKKDIQIASKPTLPTLPSPTGELEVLAEFKDAWCSEILAMKKWNEKNAKLVDLIQATSVPKLKNDNISELVSCLTKLLNDANQVVANSALKAIGNLAEGLRGNFSQYHKGFFHYITQRFKDRKTQGEAEKCLEKLSLSVNIEEMMEELKDELSDKSPAIRMHICQWLQNQILPKATNSTIKAMATSGLAAMLSSLTDDATGEIRDAALVCLSKMNTLANKDNPIHKIIEELNQAKKEKIEKISQEILSAKPPIENNTSEGLPPPEITSPLLKHSKISKLETEEIKRPTTTRKPEPSKSKPGEEPPGEDNETILVEKIGEKIIEEINKSEWKEKQKGFQELNFWLASNSKLAETILIPLTSWVKYKLKDFKESNQTILKEAFLVITFLAGLPTAGKKFASLVVPGIIERMADSKWTDTCSNILLIISDSSTPTYVALKLIDKINANLRNPNLVKVSLGLLGKLLDEYSPKMVPIKEMVTCCKDLLGNSNQSIRISATKTLAQIYSYVGETLKMFLLDVKDASRKALEAEFANVKVKENTHSLVEKRTLRGEAAMKPNTEETKATISENKESDPILDSLLPRVNVAEQINAKILGGLSAPDRKLREEAKEQIEKILLKAKYRINPNGHTTLMNVLKDRMFEPCKSLAKDFIKLISSLVCAMGPGCKQYSKIILPALMGNLGDKQNYIRAEATDAMNKFAEQAGPECLLSSAGGLLEKDNPELRSGLLAWMLENAQAFPRSECISLVHGLVRCLQDKSKENRIMAEKIVEIVMPLVGSQHFHADILDLKPTNRDFVKLILDKYSPGAGVEVPNSITIPEGDKTPRELKRNDNQGSKEPIKTSSEKKNSAKTTPKEVRKIMKEVPEFRKSMVPARRKTENKKLKNSGSGGIEPLLLEETVINSSPSSLKQKRLVQEKGQKWPVVEMKPELLEKLKKLVRPHISPSLHDLMFSGNPKKIGEAIKTLGNTVSNFSNSASVLNILDLILKWITVVIMDQNFSSLYKPVIDFLNLLFSFFVNSKYLLNDLESAILMPVIIERSGINNPSIREQIKQFILEASRAIPANKVCNYLVRGLDSHSQITKVACLELIRCMISKFGIAVITARDIKSFGRMMDVSVGGTVDPALRVECGNLLAEIYKHKGEAIWSNLGDIPDKVKAPLQERFKHVSPLKQKNSQKKYFKMPAVVPLSAMELPIITTHEDPITDIEINMDPHDIPTLPEDIEHIPENEVMNEEEKEAVGIHTLDDCILSLQGTDINEKVVALVFLNELVDKHSEALPEYVDSILETMANILDEIFMNKPLDIPIKFTKFFLFSLMKFTGKVVEGASSAQMELLMEHLLRNILYPGVDTLEGPNKEENTIYKSMNDSMVNLINKCQPDRVYKALLHLYGKFQIHKEQSKLPDLIVKCILKLTKNLPKIYSKMDIEAVLFNFHEFLISNKSEDETGPKLIKTIVNELIKIMKQNFWKYYQKVDMHPTKDIYIKRWATLMLKSQKALPVFSRYQQVPTEILEGLKQRETYDESIAGLAEILFHHPEINLEEALEGFDSEFIQEISLSVNLYMSAGVEARPVTALSQIPSHSEEQKKEGKKALATEDIPKPKNLEGSIPKLVRGGTMRERKLPQGFYQSKPNEFKPSPQQQN